VSQHVASQLGARQSSRVVVVTGGAAGIGQACAVRLARDGHVVAVGDIASADETESAIKSAGADVFAMHCDVADAGSVARFADAVIRRYERVDVVVHNAGVYPIVRFDDIDWETWRRVMDVNLNSAFHLTKAFLPGMKLSGWGRIVIIGAHVGGMPGFSAYTASKAGALGFMRCLAAEVGEHGITVNALIPGLVRTPGTTAGPQAEMGWFEMAVAGQAIKRTGQPEDLAGTVSFLVSDDADFITGQALVVDGGMGRA
jgi:NAD(P)-dependent dehydrogenase (short-subunit alcohol dehydrogenase family)